MKKESLDELIKELRSRADVLRKIKEYRKSYHNLNKDFPTVNFLQGRLTEAEYMLSYVKEFINIKKEGLKND